MHSPRPYGRFADQVELSPEDAAAVELLARRLTDYKQASSLESLKMVRDLPSGRQAIAIDMGGNFRILITEPYDAPAFVFEGIAQENVPMLFSGVITKAMVLKGDGVELKVTEQCRKRLKNYDPDRELPPAELTLQRFAVEYGDKFKYFLPKETGIYDLSQYVKQRPTWYSGAMAQVMQIVGGYGKQNMAELPEDEVERASFLIPESWMKKVRDELGNIRLPGYTGFPDEKGQFACDYSHGSSDLVAFDDDNNPWLVKVFSRGVFAMPLPIVPITATEAFREYIDEVGDDEIIEVLDRFGGMPTGEGFPASENDFESWKRAGVIIKVCDTADFYDEGKQGFYGACGWSINSKGSEGFNTCWEYDNQNLMQAYGYKLKLNLGQAENRGLLKSSWEFSSQSDSDTVSRYLSPLYEKLGGSEARELAIKYKIRRSAISDILARAGSGGEGEINYWDNLEVDPIAIHSGSVSRTTSGAIFWPIDTPQSQPRLKFPTISGEGTQSFYLSSPDYSGDYGRSDTVVFGCYVEDSLQVIKYFYDPREYTEEETSTYEECMNVGAWDKSSTTGSTTLMGHFYTSSFDDREPVSPTTSQTNVKGSDLGYGQPLFSTPGFFDRVGGLGRTRYYQHRTTVITTSGYGIDNAVCVPVFNRDAILYAFSDVTGSKSESVNTSRGGVSDPTSYEFWTHDDLFHWMGSTGSGNKGVPSPKEGAPVYLDTMNYSPNACSDFADSGNWYGFNGSFMDITGIVGHLLSRKGGHVGGGSVGGEAPGFQPFSSLKVENGKSSGRASISMAVAGSRVVHTNKPDTWYYGLSPIEDIYFYRDSIFNAIGKAEYASTYEGVSNGIRKYWGGTVMADNKSAHHFIGVING